MAVITATDMTGTGERDIAITTLGASDTFVYNGDRNPVLILNNVTVGALTPNIDGDGQTAVTVSGIGSVDVSGGLTLASVAAGDYVAIPLKSIREYLTGTITVTGGDAMEASILEF